MDPLCLENHGAARSAGFASGADAAHRCSSPGRLRLPSLSAWALSQRTLRLRFLPLCFFGRAGFPGPCAVSQQVRRLFRLHRLPDRQRLYLDSAQHRNAAGALSLASRDDLLRPLRVRPLPGILVVVYRLLGRIRAGAGGTIFSHLAARERDQSRSPLRRFPSQNAPRDNLLCRALCRAWRLALLQHRCTQQDHGTIDDSR